MPVITIYGMPELGQKGLKGLVSELKTEVAKIEEFELGPEEIRVYLPADLQEDTGGGITVFISVVRAPRRTYEVQFRLAETVALILRDLAKLHLPRYDLVEVYVKEFDASKQVFFRAKKDPPPTSPDDDETRSWSTLERTPSCRTCGHRTVRNGLNYRCPHCGSVAPK